MHGDSRRHNFTLCQINNLNLVIVSLFQFYTTLTYTYTDDLLFLLQVALLVAAAHAAISKGNAGWNDDPSTQYHIQTDEGPERYFRYQTTSGQYRKEKRLEDGTVIGTYGWVDPNGMLLLNDYVADNAGYRIVRTKKVFVGLNSDIPEDRLDTKTPAVPAVPKVTVIVPTPTPTPFAPIKVYDSPNLYDHPSSSPVKPNAANFNSHPYYASNEYTPVFGYQKKNSYQKPSYQQILNNYQAPAVYQPASNYQQDSGSTYRKPIDTVRVFTPKQQAYYDQQKRLNSQQYDGISTTQNGFKYYLPRQYHEEESTADNERAGSYGYIDPFGIRRVVYYNSSPGSGFQVKKNNRYVGFESTPYDPRV